MYKLPWNYLKDQQIIEFIEKIGEKENYRIRNLEDTYELADELLEKEEWTIDVWNLDQAMNSDDPVTHVNDDNRSRSIRNINKYKSKLYQDELVGLQKYIDENIYKLNYDEIMNVYEITK